MTGLKISCRPVELKSACCSILIEGREPLSGAAIRRVIDAVKGFLEMAKILARKTYQSAFRGGMFGQLLSYWQLGRRSEMLLPVGHVSAFEASQDVAAASACE